MTVSSIITYPNRDVLTYSKIVDMSVPCPTVTVLPSVNIFATDIVITPTTCSEPCSLTINVTYTNSGNVIGGLIPAITIDGIPTSLPFTILDPGTTIIKTFSVTNLMKGSHIICVEPIGNTSCQTINVQPTPVVSAALPIWLGAGLLFGYVIQKAKKCNIYETKEECQKNDCQWKKKKCVSFNREDQFLIDTLREKQRQLKLPPEGIPVCKDNTCTIGKWKAVYRKGKAPIITHGH